MLLEVGVWFCFYCLALVGVSCFGTTLLSGTMRPVRVASVSGLPFYVRVVVLVVSSGRELLLFVLTLASRRGFVLEASGVGARLRAGLLARKVL